MKKLNLNLIPSPEKVIVTEGSCLWQQAALEKRESTLCGEEGYRLQICENKIIIEGSEKGIHYGEVTLQQLQEQYGEELPCLEISDSPRFGYRGWMLDSARHFLPEEEVCRLIDAAAYFKLNRMHWHLVDDQGWRVEIRRYPKLTEIGSRRGMPYFGDIDEPQEQNGCFTQEQVRRIVAYARERGMEIIPELEIPGHESALLAAYPEYACQAEDGSVMDGPMKVGERAGIYENLLCAGREETLVFLKNILDELMELFPGEMVHIGGDEACKGHWRKCPACQAKKRALGLKDENALQQWLVVQAGKYLQEKGRKPVVWNDSLRGAALPTDFVVQEWMGDHGLLADFAKRGGRFIQSSNTLCYLDYPHYLIDAQKILGADPYPDYLGEQERASMLGIECPLWTERVPTLERAGFMLYPRLGAMAEVMWTKEASRDNASFPRRWENAEKYLQSIGVTPAPSSYLHLSPALAAEDRADYDRMVNNPRYREMIDHDDAMVKEENRIYGVESE